MFFGLLALLILIALVLTIYAMAKPQQAGPAIPVAVLLLAIVELLVHYPK